MKKTIWLIPIFGFFLTGCASMFGGGKDETICSGGAGVPCVSSRTAYQMSNNTTNFARSSDGKSFVSDDAPVSAVAVSLPQPIMQPMPVMEAAQVMRVWVNTWVDAGGDLHYPSFVFTEITPRKWAVGNVARTVQAKIVSPYRIDHSTQDGDPALVTSPSARPPPGVASPVSPASQIAPMPGMPSVQMPAGPVATNR